MFNKNLQSTPSKINDTQSEMLVQRTSSLYENWKHEAHREQLLNLCLPHWPHLMKEGNRCMRQEPALPCFSYDSNTHVVDNNSIHPLSNKHKQSHSLLFFRHRDNRANTVNSTQVPESTDNWYLSGDWATELASDTQSREPPWVTPSRHRVVWYRVASF